MAYKRQQRSEKNIESTVVQEENDSCKETFTIAEKKFHKQIADVPIFDCIRCEQTLFRKYLI